MTGKMRKRVLGLVAGVLAATCSSSLLFEGVESVEAATRLYGVQQVVDKISTDDPFVILELVSDNAQASFGAYVQGEEPLIDSKLLAGCDDQTARRQKVLSLYGNLVVEKESNGDGLLNPMYYEHSSIYQEQVATPSTMTGWDVIEFTPTKNEDGTTTYYAEERTGYYEAVAEGEKGDYIATLVEDTTSDTTVDETQTVAEDEVTEGESADSTDSTNDTTLDETEDTAEYEYSYKPGEGTHKWIDSDTATESSYLVEFEKLYYKVSVTSNDWFVEDILEYEVAAGDVSNVEVVTITPSELELNISKGYLAEYDGIKIQGWNEVDMIYLSNSSCLNLTTSDLALLSSYSDTELITEEVTETATDGTVTTTEVTTEVYSNDISAQTGYNIYEYVLNTNIPVIMDSSLVTEVTSLETSLQSLDTNLQKLAFLLWDYTTTTTPETYKDTSTNTTIDVSTWVTEWPTQLTSILLTNVAAKVSATYGNVQGSVYINNDSNMVDVDLSTVFSSVAFANVSSGTTYTEAEKLLGGISAVVDEIDSENFYNELSNVAFTTEYNTTDSQIDISKSSVIKYILNYAYRRATVYKDTITVLDIEPTRYSKLTETEIRSWLKSADSDRIKKINIVQTTTSEFIGTLSDLTAEYDLIYIGDCIGPSGKVGAMNQTSGGITNYNDNDMDGLIYTHTGDTYAAPAKFRGLLDTEYTNSNKTALTNDKLITRFSGNDITEEKMDELLEFANAGYPVVVADKFYTKDDSNQTIVNSYYVDNSSWMYKFMNDTISKENVMSDNLDDSALLATYINMSKLYISMISSPLEYSVTYNSSGYIDTVQYLKENNGKYTLEYTFELADNSEAKLDTVAYEVRIYIDTNADGRYDTTEELDGLTVRDLDTGNEVEYNKLVTGVRYTVARELPKGYVGMIPWKMEVKQVLTSGSTASNMTPVHTSTTGYTAVPADEITNIKILQIKHQYAGYSASGLDLSTNDTFQELFQNVSDKMKYNIDITTVGAASYVSAYNTYLSDNNLSDNEAGYTAFYNAYFADYDMIMIGFEDMFGDITSEGATMAIKLFIESGRSVLFSHDTTSFVNANQTAYGSIFADGKGDFWGYYLNQYIRSIVGMDRYGVTEESLSFLKNGTSISLIDSDNKETANKVQLDTANKDIAFKAKSNQSMATYEVHGYSNGNLVMQNLDTSYAEDVVYSSSNEASSRVSKISQVNKGQITTYPFDINIDDSTNANVTTTTSGSTTYQMMNPDTMTVKDTHSQYYQLDLMLDKTGDGESDIVVWYCLADEMYDAVPNDVRNNYYIYSVGNIMYTGMGHSGSSVSLDEAKLFVNTMIASFNSGKKDPTIAIIKDADNKGVIKQYSYRTYDPELGMIDTENEVINFYVNDSNIISGTKTIALKYYVEVSQARYETGIATESTKDLYTTTTVGGSTVYLREIDASDIESSVSTVQSNAVATLTLKPTLFNNAFMDTDETSGTSTRNDTSSIRIFISAQTTLDYDSTRPDETTGVVFTSLTVKTRDLFDLD